MSTIGNYYRILYYFYSVISVLTAGFVLSMIILTLIYGSGQDQFVIIIAVNVGIVLSFVFLLIGLLFFFRQAFYAYAINYKYRIPLGFFICLLTIVLLSLIIFCLNKRDWIIKYCSVVFVDLGILSMTILCGISFFLSPVILLKPDKSIEYDHLYTDTSF